MKAAITETASSFRAWNTSSLEEICIFVNGLWKGKTPPYSNVAVLRNTNFRKDGNLDLTDIAVLDVETKQLAKRKLEFGDIIVEKSGGGPKQPVGRVALFEQNGGLFSLSNFTSAARIKDITRIDCRYLHKYLHWLYGRLYT